MHLIFLSSVALVSCESNFEKDNSTTYKVLIASTKDYSIQNEYSAKLQGRQTVEVRPQICGLITSVLIEEGQKVKKGQPLFIIDQVPYKAAYEEAAANVKSAEAKLRTAELNLKSTESLHSKEIVSDYNLHTSQNELAQAQAALSQAQAQETNAKNNLSYTVVTSPADGVAGMINYRVGALVSSNIDTPLVVISDDEVIYAYFSLSDSKVIDLVEKFGSIDKFIGSAPKISLRMSNGQIYSKQGKISAISGIVDESTGAVTIRADYDNSSKMLRAGSNGSIVIPETYTNCIVIPQGATYQIQNKLFAYKVVNGKAVSTEISVMPISNGTEYALKSGLEPGDTIIAEGAGLVKDGANILIEEKDLIK
ncbi:MAG: efflux RND transporter periplasmic adaptor subunit [Muribaculaceae bacterium]